MVDSFNPGAGCMSGRNTQHDLPRERLVKEMEPTLMRLMLSVPALKANFIYPKVEAKRPLSPENLMVITTFQG